MSIRDSQPQSRPERYRDRERVPTARESHVALPTGTRFIVLSELDIVWLEANGHRTTVYTLSGPLHVNRGLGRILSSITTNDIVRIHRSVAIHLRHIRELSAKAHGDWRITLDNSKELSVSRTFRSRLFKQLRAVR